MKSTARAKRHADDWWKNHPTGDMECHVFNICIHLHICLLRYIIIYLYILIFTVKVIETYMINNDIHVYVYVCVHIHIEQ